MFKPHNFRLYKIDYLTECGRHKTATDMAFAVIAALTFSVLAVFAETNPMERQEQPEGYSRKPLVETQRGMPEAEILDPFDIQQHTGPAPHGGMLGPHASTFTVS